MKYILEERIKSRLYLEYEKKHYKKGMPTADFNEYVHQMIRFVEENFQRLYYEEIKKQEVSQDD